MTSSNVFKAILALDSYNRGYKEEIPGLGGEGTKIGDFEILRQSDIGLGEPGVDVGFYAIAYENTATGEKIISYRGTDTLIKNPLYGWPQGIGAALTGQALLGAEFYKAVVGGGEPVTDDMLLTADIEFVGHSLGGGLAGLMASIYHKDAVIFNNMPFEDSAQAAYELVSDGVPINILNPSQMIIDAANRDKLIKTYYNDNEFLAWQPNANGVIAYATIGEFLGVFRIFQETYVNRLNPHTNEGGRDLHSQALLVNLLYERGEVPDKDWHNIAPIFIDTLFENPVGEASGSDNAAQMLTKIAYSAIDESATSTTVFGDTAIHAMWDDANDLGKAMEGSPSSILEGSKDSISKVFVQFAGRLADSKVHQSSDEEVLGGVLELSADSKLLTLNFEQSLWTTAGNPALDTIIGREEILNPMLFLINNAVPKDAIEKITFVTQDGGLFSGVPSASAGNFSLVVGSTEGDNITGSSGDDVLVGREDNDTYSFFGAFGNDTIIDDGGVINIDDTILQGTAKSIGGNIYQLKGHNLLYSDKQLLILSKSGGSITVPDFTSGKFDIVLGSGGDENGSDKNGSNNILSGTTIFSDDISGSRYNELIQTGVGDDSFDLFGKYNTLHGGDGNDIFSVYGAHNTLFGGKGDDYMSHRLGFSSFSEPDAVIFGGDGNDIITVLHGVNILHGGQGNDTLEGHLIFNNVFYGGDGDDTIRGSIAATNNVFMGGEGNDSYHLPLVFNNIIFDSSGHNNLYFGSSTEHPVSGVAVSTSQGDYKLVNNGYEYILKMHGSHLFIENQYARLILADFVDGSFGIKLGETEHDDTPRLMAGTMQGDTLVGFAGDDRLNGNGGDDILNGGDGDDIISGGSGDDVIDAGAGDDHIYAEAGADIIDGGDGIDIASYWGSKTGITIDLEAGTGQNGYAQGDSLSNIEQIGATFFNDNLSGNALENLFFSGSGDDVIDGRAGDDRIYASLGNDTLIGGAGADTLFGSTGNDIFKYNAPDESTVIANDIIRDFVQGEDMIDVSAFVSFSGLSITHNSTHTFIHTQDPANDFELELAGVHMLKVSDFV